MKNKISSRKRAAKTVLQVVSISATSGIRNTEGTDMEAISVLQEFGFISLKVSGKHIVGLAPADEIIFLIEYDNTVASNQKPFTLVNMRKGKYLQELDSGRTIYIQSEPGANGKFSIAAVGGRLSGWEFTCINTTPAIAENYLTLFRTKGVLSPKAVLPKGAYRDARAEALKDDESYTPPPARIKVPVVTVVVPEKVNHEVFVRPQLKEAPAAELKQSVVKSNSSIIQVTPQKAVPVSPSMVVLIIPVNRIRANKDQPRKSFDLGELKQLAESLKQDGQNDPIEVIEVSDDPSADFELVKGERRLRAAQSIGLTTLKAIVRSKEEIPDRKAQHRACFIADFHHSKYKKMETALALMYEHKQGATPKELSSVCGKSLAWVYTHLALNKLIPPLFKLLDSGLPRREQISFSVATQLVQVPPDHQMAIYEEVSKIKGVGLQLIRTKELVGEIVGNKQGIRKNVPADRVKNLETMVPRLAANALIADGYDGDVFRSLLTYRKPEDVNLILHQIGVTIQKLQSVSQKIKQTREGMTPK